MNVEVDLDETQSAIEPVGKKRKEDDVTRERMDVAARRAAKEVMKEMASEHERREQRLMTEMASENVERERRLIDHMDGSVASCSPLKCRTVVAMRRTVSRRWRQ